MIKAVVFDFGDVLTLPGNSLRVLEKYKQKLNTDPEIALEKVYRSEKLSELMRGNISLNEFNEFVRKIQGTDRETNEKIQQEMKENLSLNKKVLDIAERHRDYKLAILSDHIKGIFEHQIDRFRLAEVFDVIIFSAEHGSLKADGELFDILLEQLELRAEECVFIDDLERNIKVAESKGFHTIHFKNAETLEDQLSEIIKRRTH